jgi:hypothetical protein
MKRNPAKKRSIQVLTREVDGFTAIASNPTS